MKRKLLTAIICALLLAVKVFAHEYWFEPETFFPAPGQNTVVDLYVGGGLVKDRAERSFQLAKTTSFQLFSASSQTVRSSQLNIRTVSSKIGGL